MGKSSNSCFKILSCGADAGVENDDGVPEVEVGESQEATAINCYSPISSSIPEKTHTQETVNDKPSTLVDSGSAEAVPTEVATDVHDSATAAAAAIPDSAAIIIQAAIRRYLAHQELRKLKHVVKLQAAVRSHLVRRQAVGALRCLHAIVRLQMLARSRHAQKLAINEANMEIRNEQAKRTTSVNLNNTYASQGLFSNAFARQLLESTPKTKPISIKRDPSKEDSAWKWLERWMVVTPVDIKHVQDKNFLSKEEDDKLRVSDILNDTSDKTVPAFAESDTAETKLPKTGKSDLTSATYHAPDAKSSVENDAMKQTHDGDEGSNLNQFDSEKVVEGYSVSLAVPLSPQSDVTPESTVDATVDHVKSVPQSDKKLSSEPLESEAKKVPIGSRKGSNPAYFAAQSKFEELSSGHVVGKPIKSTTRDSSGGLKVNKLRNKVGSSSKTDEHKADSSSKSNSIKADSSPKGDDLNFVESQYPKSHVTSSECGTEISISSILDSPDRSEAEAGEIVLEIRSLDKEKYGTNGRADAVPDHNKVNSASIDGSLEQSTEPHNVEHSNGKDASAFADNSVQLEDTSDPQVNIEKALDHVVDRSSPNASPRSHITVLESQGTPSSQISSNTKKSKGVVLARRQKSHKSHLAPKSSPANPSSDLGGRSSTEHLPNDAKTMRRQSSFEVTKADQVDHEPLNSNSSSLPSYMQATESARAKVHVSVSPKASPDVHDKDNHPKKRHSLPIANSKQGSSPRMQRSTSQAQQNLKCNGVHSLGTSTNEDGRDN